jgi:exopolyphosphatase / guanosine-5'-triphosphate,3'-diphosphate pyrophosphatase
VKRITVIDAGSNAIRLAIAQTSGNSFKILYKLREPIRLGADVFVKGKLSPAVIDQTIRAFKKFKRLSLDFESEAIYAIGTSALRDASNQKQVLHRLVDETGIKLKVISGARESELVFKAINHEMDLKAGKSLLIDIGGGSVELVGARNGKKLRGKSFPIGTVRLLRKLKFNPNTYHNQIKMLEPSLKASLRFIDSFPGTFSYCVGVGGNIERMGRVNSLITGESRNNKITLNELLRMYDLLSPCSLEKRKRLFRLKSDQADVILPAIVLCIYFMQSSNTKELYIPGVGIKDGLILEELHSLR